MNINSSGLVKMVDVELMGLAELGGDLEIYSKFTLPKTHGTQLIIGQKSFSSVFPVCQKKIASTSYYFDKFCIN